MRKIRFCTAALLTSALLSLCAGAAPAEVLKFTGSPGFLLSPAMVVGVYTPEGKTNFATFHRGGVASSGKNGAPLRIVFGINNTGRSYTYQFLKAAGACTINLPSVKHMADVMLFGRYSGRPLSGNQALLTENGGYQDKLAVTGLTAVRGSAVNAPMIEEFPISLECELEDEISVTEGRPNRLMVLKVVKVWADESYLDAGGKISPMSSAPDSSILYYSGSRSPAGGFYGYGEFVGKSGQISAPYRAKK